MSGRPGWDRTCANDYSLDPGLVGRRVEVRASRRDLAVEQRPLAVYDRLIA